MLGVPIQTMAYQGLSVSSKVSEMGDLKGREMRPVTSKLPSSCGSSVHRQHYSVRAARFHCTATRVHRLSCKDCIRMVTRRIPIPSSYVTLALFLYLDIHLAASFSRWSASASPAFVVPACLPRGRPAATALSLLAVFVAAAAVAIEGELCLKAPPASN